MNLEDLDKKLWKKLKKEAGIKSSKWFKKADASVGKYIEAMQKAKEKFEFSQLAEDLLKYQTALDKLNDAFDKFVDTKGLDEVSDTDVKSSEKDKLRKEIDSWKDNISAAKKDLDKKISKLSKSLKGDMKKLNQLESGKRKEVWDKMGFSDTFNI